MGRAMSFLAVHGLGMAELAPSGPYRRDGRDDRRHSVNTEDCPRKTDRTVVCILRSSRANPRNDAAEPGCQASASEREGAGEPEGAAGQPWTGAVVPLGFDGRRAEGRGRMIVGAVA